MRICIYPGCVTVLNKYNKDRLCSLHHRVCYSHGIVMEKGKFFRKRYGYTGWVSKKGRKLCGFINIPVGPNELSLLKEDYDAPEET